MRQRRSNVRSAYNSAYNTAKDYPGTIAAVIVGLGITAALVWAARRAGGWSNLQDSAIDYARQGVDRAREGYDKAREVIRERVARTQDEAEQITRY